MIQRSLKRPSSGMPLSWRKAGSSQSKKPNPLQKYIRGISSMNKSLSKLFTKSKKFIIKNSSSVLGLSLLLSALYFQRDSISIIGSTMMQKVFKTDSKEKEVRSDKEKKSKENTSLLKNLRMNNPIQNIQVKKVSQKSKSEDHKVNLQTLNNVYRQSLFDRLMMRFFRK